MFPLAFTVVILCVAGTVAAFAFGLLTDDESAYPGYTVNGDVDGTEVSGTASCIDTGESSREKVLCFTYTLEHGDDTIVISSYLFMDGSRPVAKLYSVVGAVEIDGAHTTVWRPVEYDGFEYCISEDGTVLGISIEKDGLSAFAQAVP